jgi:hypothetical protein
MSSGCGRWEYWMWCGGLKWPPPGTAGLADWHMVPGCYSGFGLLCRYWAGVIKHGRSDRVTPAWVRTSVSVIELLSSA